MGAEPVAHGSGSLDATPSRQRTLAWLAGLGFVIAGGLAYRAAFAWLNRAPETIPLPRGTLAALPSQIGDWHGQDTPLAESIIRVADVDDYLCREYRNQRDGRAVAIFVAYGVRARDLVPHRPEVCYPGNGWTQQRLEQRSLRLADGSELSARLFRFALGGLDPSSLDVLNYYIVDGRTCPDVSLLRSKAWRGQATIRYMAQVQITTRVNPLDPESSEQAVIDFARVVAPRIRDLLEQAIAQHEKITVPDTP